MDIIMPKMGESVSEGTIIKWHKKKGDSVKRDEIIFEISTDKVDTEIPSPADGILSEVKFNEGDTVEVGTVVAAIDVNGEAKTQPKPAEKMPEALPVKDGTKSRAAVSAEKTPEQKPHEEKAAVSITAEEAKTAGGNLIDLAMPKMGESVMEGTIIKWHKKVGEAVKKDETVFEISTDKVDTEVPSPSNGILAEILVGEQETVEVGTIVARLSASGTVKPKEELKNKRPAPVQQNRTEPAEQMKPQPAQSAARPSVQPKVVPGEQKIHQNGNDGNKFLSPLVMNIARKENISFDELERITGTGLDGRVTKRDVLDYIESRGRMKEEPEAAAEAAAEEIQVNETREDNYEQVKASSYSTSGVQPVYSSHEVERIPMDNVRQKIMQHMINSRDTSVHVSAMIEADVTKIYNFLKANRDAIQGKLGVKLTYMPFVAHACIKALKEYPLVNATVDGYTIVKKKFINLGIAVAVEPNGLIVPNIKNADEKNVIGLARAIGDIAERARTKRLTPDDITNGTFSITNYGVFGTIFGTPIINQPEVAILGVGTVVKKPVVIEVDGIDTIAVKPTMALTLTHDHRLVDGMLGGRFLKSIKDTLESFSENEI